MKLENVDTIGIGKAASLELVIHNVRYTIIEDKEQGFMLVRNPPTTLTIRPLNNLTIKVE